MNDEDKKALDNVLHQANRHVTDEQARQHVQQQQWVGPRRPPPLNLFKVHAEGAIAEPDTTTWKEVAEYAPKGMVDLVALQERFQLVNFCVPCRLELRLLDNRHVRYVSRRELRRVQLMISLSLFVPHRESGHHGWLRFDRVADAGVFEDERAAWAYLRRVVVEAMTHEVDEAIQVDGIRVFDPHAGERKGPF